MKATLAELQDQLARVVTDGAALAAFERAPGEALGGLVVADVVRYARGLGRKRWDDVSAAVPLSAQVISNLDGRYEQWLAGHPAPAVDTVLSPGAAEALRALPDLARGIAADPGEAPWAAELLAFEVLLACSRADRRSRGFRTRFAVHAIAAELRRGLIPIDPAPEPHAYAFDARGARWKAMA